ncbi:MAG: hypothetical protein ABEJ70_09175 [Halobacteriaceae archaeon]
MKAGVLAVVDGSFTAVDSFVETVTDDGVDLERCLTIDRVFSLPSGEMAFAGRAAADRLATGSTTSIVDGDIVVSEEARPVTRHTAFVGVPGEFVAVDSTRGTFALDLIADDTGTDIARATLDLDAFYEAHEAATPWKAGFEGVGDDDVNGVFHGADLRTDHDLQGILDRSRLTQVGLTYGYGGDEVKMTASRSGYVEVYRPTAFDSAAYLEYLIDEVVPHVV